jgi:hypothetical protein
VPLEVKAEYTLSASLPSRHSGPKLSMNARSWLVGPPNRVGVPNSTTSAQSTSSRLGRAMSAVSWTCWFQAGIALITSGAAVSATFRSRTSAPAFSAPSAAACARAWMVPVAL